MSLKQNKINPDAIAWLENFSEELDTDPDIIDAMPIEDVRRELHEMGADVGGFHSKLKKTLGKYSLKKLAEELITWISPLWLPPMAGETMTASASSEQEHSFEMDYGEYIRISCYWGGDCPPLLEMSWNANITSDSRLWARFVSPDTGEILSEICLGSDLEGKERFGYNDLGFDPVNQKWGISVLLEAR